MMSKKTLFWINVLILIAIGCLVSVNITAITIADIQYGDWAKITNSEGTFFYTSWTDDMSDEQIKKQYQAQLDEGGLKIERVTGYGVRISRIHKIRKKLTAGRMHLFDTEKTAIRFAKENDIPDKQIIISVQNTDFMAKPPVK